MRYAKICATALKSLADVYLFFCAWHSDEHIEKKDDNVVDDFRWRWYYDSDDDGYDDDNIITKNEFDDEHCPEIILFK